MSGHEETKASKDSRSYALFECMRGLCIHRARKSTDSLGIGNHGCQREVSFRDGYRVGRERGGEKLWGNANGIGGTFRERSKTNLDESGADSILGYRVACAA